MPFSDRTVLTGLLVFAVGVVVGIGIGSASAVSALTQGSPDVLQTWSGVVALPYWVDAACNPAYQRRRWGGSNDLVK